ncbi:ribonuclease H-like domain-containing protein [Tanacetum coccineum]|uniref:Ribonuclease H-like domain-containing protein n=1 Tax=Tanacetum coccineum TaxID=301880 RepID=A0ABQ5ELU5_9ASTR
MMMCTATNNSTQLLYPCVYLPTHQSLVQFVSFSAQQSPIQYYGAPAMSPAPVSYASLPHAFHTMTLQNRNWNMDTRASSHLADNTCILTSFSNSNIYPSVFVGNVHQFTRDNDVSVEFDAYGFSVKDYQTRRLLRCDSTGDLYPVTQQLLSQTSIFLLSFSSTTWHRRLGHPGDDVLRHLESRNLISCRKSKLPPLCHACQLVCYDGSWFTQLFGVSAQRTSKFAAEILERAHMQKCNPCKTPVDTESKLGPNGDPISDPTLYRSLATHYALFRGTIDHDLLLHVSSTTQLTAYTDADWLVTLSRSSAEAEYRGVANVVAETAWL